MISPVTVQIERHEHEGIRPWYEVVGLEFGGIELESGLARVSFDYSDEGELRLCLPLRLVNLSFVPRMVGESGDL